jgi:16S rRNA (guanine527-N7)-methyltransferase
VPEVNSAAADSMRRIARRTKRAHLTLSPAQVASLAAYLDLLTLWNRKINLTSLSDPGAAIDRLILEPALTASLVPDAATSLLDVGSGGGSPAIPLKICVPRLKLWMVESKTRKAAFLMEAVRQLKLADATVETHRFEDLLTRTKLREGLDLVTVRALRVDAHALVDLQSFLRPGGQLWLFRSGTGTVPVLPPQLQFEGEDRLVAYLGSRLTRLRKAG